MSLAFSSLLALLLPAGVWSTPAPSSPADTLWNSPRVVELLERGRVARAQFRSQGDLESYQAEAEGHIYFYVDPETGDDPLLIRVDQVAVELYWKAPNLTRQVIVGLRDERRLPVRDFRYYLDRLSVVQNGFGDLVQIGDGLDVAGAPHPLALLPVVVGGEILDAREVYEARLQDSVAVQLPGRPDPVTIYEVEVRPRDPTVPALVGSIFLDRETGSVVRMEFTFTPAAYTDPRTDRIQISLDHGLWDGRFWLPREQRIRVRREVPELDLGVGTVIQAVMRVGPYTLNPPLDAELFRGSPVVSVPAAERESYPFREELLGRVAEEGLETSLRRVEMAELQARARELLREADRSGLPPLRLHLPGASSLLSYGRSRGVGVGGGMVWDAGGGVRIRSRAGYHPSAGQPLLGVDLSAPSPWGTLRDRWEFSGWWGEEGDLGLRPGSPGALNSLSSLALGQDDRDPFRRHGGEFRWSRPEGRWSWEAAFGAEWIRSAPWVVRESPLGSHPFRMMRPVDRGVEIGPRVAASWSGSTAPGRSRSFSLSLAPGHWRDAESSGGPGSGSSGATFRGEMRLQEVWRSPDYRSRVQLQLDAWGAWGVRPAHHYRLVGGRGTVEGWEYRALAGSTGGRAALGWSRDLHPTWLRLHTALEGAWVASPPDDLAAAWALGTEGGASSTSTRTPFSASVGVGIFYDILQVGVARGLGGGRWSVLVRPDQVWWPWL